MPAQNNSVLISAARFAEVAHGEQKRKYTNEPYVVHCYAVADLVATVTSDIEVIAAATLHDTVEDTPVTVAQLKMTFGVRVALLVDEVTHREKPGDGNRAARKTIDREFLAKASPEAMTIKLADIIDNTFSIATLDSGFAKIYLPEQRLLLNVLKKGNSTLWGQAKQIIDDYFREELPT